MGQLDTFAHTDCTLCDIKKVYLLCWGKKTTISQQMRKKTTTNGDKKIVTQKIYSKRI